MLQNLESGKPCPVCGSTDHPHPCEKSVWNHVDISEEKLQNMQTNVDKLRKDSGEGSWEMQLRPDQNMIHEKIPILPVYESSRNVCTEVFLL